MTRISATEASRNFSDILNRAQYRGESFEVMRAGEVVARIEPPGMAKMTLGEILDRIDLGPGLDAGDSVLFEMQIAKIRHYATMPPSLWD